MPTEHMPLSAEIIAVILSALFAALGYLVVTIYRVGAKVNSMEALAERLDRHEQECATYRRETREQFEAGRRRFEELRTDLAVVKTDMKYVRENIAKCDGAG